MFENKDDDRFRSQLFSRLGTTKNHFTGFYRKILRKKSYSKKNLLVNGKFHLPYNVKILNCLPLF